MVSTAEIFKVTLFKTKAKTSENSEKPGIEPIILLPSMALRVSFYTRNIYKVLIPMHKGNEMERITMTAMLQSSKKYVVNQKQNSNKCVHVKVRKINLP